MKKKNLTCLLCCASISASLLAGCSTTDSSSTKTQETESVAVSESATEVTEAGDNLADVTVAGWHIVVEQFMMDHSLENVSVALGYTGVETTDYVKEASDGNVFCLVKLLIEKEKSTEVIDWETFTLTDSDGNIYNRLDDEFLVDLGMMRMPGTKLNFGSNEGWIAYEISESVTDLQLNYDFAEDSFSCTLS